MTEWIYQKLTEIRDISRCPDFLREAIDYIRYKWVYPYDEYEL